MEECRRKKQEARDKERCRCRCKKTKEEKDNGTPYIPGLAKGTSRAQLTAAMHRTSRWLNETT
jgi:hypothetical protein